MIETVLLVEHDPLTGALRMRPVVVRRGLSEIMTVMRISPERTVSQLFRCEHDEKDLGGRYRVFREVVEPAAAPPAETPQYDETHVKFTDEVSKPTIF